MRQRTTTIRATLVIALLVVGVGVVLFHGHDTPKKPAPSTSTTTTTTAPGTTTSTTTTIPEGAFPQTSALPPAHTHDLNGRMRALLSAIATGNPAHGYGAFFPLAAYLQTKAGGGNTEDWHYRLIGHFDQDVATYHRELGPHAADAKLVGYSVDDAAAVWVVPGVEENKGPYWRIYDTTLTYAIGHQTGSLRVSTMISWRGEWYVVHLIGFNS